MSIRHGLKAAYGGVHDALKHDNTRGNPVGYMVHAPFLVLGLPMVPVDYVRARIRYGWWLTRTEYRKHVMHEPEVAV